MLTLPEARQLATQVKPDDLASEAALTRQLLKTMIDHATPTMRKAVLADLLRHATAFRSLDAPGHRPWYAHYLQAVAFAAERLGEPVVPAPKDLAGATLDVVPDHGVWPSGR